MNQREMTLISLGLSTGLLIGYVATEQYHQYQYRRALTKIANMYRKAQAASKSVPIKDMFFTS